MGCDDSDGPGHAPRYLYVSRITMRKYVYIVSAVIVFLVVTISISIYDVKNELKNTIKSRGYKDADWSIVFNGLSFNDVPDYWHIGIGYGVKDRTGALLRIEFIWSIYPFREVLTRFS